MSTAKAREPIDVITIFDQASARPFSFKYAGKKFIVEKINLTFSERAGRGTLRYYSVTAEGNYFKLVLDTEGLRWYVEEVMDNVQ